MTPLSVPCSTMPLARVSLEGSWPGLRPQWEVAVAAVGRLRMKTKLGKLRGEASSCLGDRPGFPVL